MTSYSLFSRGSGSALGRSDSEAELSALLRARSLSLVLCWIFALGSSGGSTNGDKIGLNSSVIDKRCETAELSSSSSRDVCRGGGEERSEDVGSSAEIRPEGRRDARRVVDDDATGVPVHGIESESRAFSECTPLV